MKKNPRTDENDEAHRIDCFLHCFFSDLPLVPRAFPCYSDFIISPNQSVTLDLTKSIEKIDRINCSCGVFYSPAPSVGDAIDGTLDFISHLLFSFSSLSCKRYVLSPIFDWFCCWFESPFESIVVENRLGSDFFQNEDYRDWNLDTFGFEVIEIESLVSDLR